MKRLDLTHYIAVISDFDDTILDNKAASNGQGLHERSRLYALRKVGARHNLSSLAAIAPEVNASAFHHTPIYSLEGAFWWLLIQAGIVRANAVFDNSHPLIQELTTAKSVAYRHLLSLEGQEVPGARNFFGILHNGRFANKLGIASAGHKVDILTFLKSHGFSGYFLPEHIIAKEDVTYPKPHAESFQKAVQALGIPADQYHRVLAFEDDPRGIIAAKTLGLFTCAVTTTFTAEYLLSQPIQPDSVAADFNAYTQIFGLK
ncbi:MAG TPA: HAD family phosphatase [Candidatus Saccharimonadales bacterium]|nr:HAD family phosphatase [Candidatus Saccharimonadales bacterium]